MIRSFTCTRGLIAAAAITASSVSPAFAGEVLIKDDFNRIEADDSQEQVGGQWGTNSKTRAQGNKQVDLVDGAMHIVRHPVADHGVSVTHEAAFKNATLTLRFKIDKGDELGINIADMKEKSVHAGHLCVAKIRLNKLSITDLKTGQMNLKVRSRTKAKKPTEADKALLKRNQKAFPLQLAADQWHTLEVKISDETMAISINGKPVGSFTSAGIGHDTKSRLRLAVAKSAWIDDLILIADTPQ